MAFNAGRAKPPPTQERPHPAAAGLQAAADLTLRATRHICEAMEGAKRKTLPHADSSAGASARDGIQAALQALDDAWDLTSQFAGANQLHPGCWECLPPIATGASDSRAALVHN